MTNDEIFKGGVDGGGTGKGGADEDREREYKCNFCDRPFGDEASLREHQRTHNQGDASGYRVPSTPQESENAWRQADRANREHSGDQPQGRGRGDGNRRGAGQTGSLDTSLGSDIQDPGRMSEGGPETGPFRCPVCGQLFDNEGDLLSHEQQHMGEETGRTFSSDDAPRTTAGQLSDRGNQTVPWGEEHRGWTTGTGDREEGEATGLETPGGRNQGLSSD